MANDGLHKKVKRDLKGFTSADAKVQSAQEEKCAEDEARDEISDVLKEKKTKRCLQEINSSVL